MKTKCYSEVVFECCAEHFTLCILIETIVCILHHLLGVLTKQISLESSLNGNMLVYNYIFLNTVNFHII